MKEFNINNFLKLRLENGKTIIYVNGKRFNQCKYLLLAIPFDQITPLEEIESIDEAVQRIGNSLESERLIIPPKIEFWGHCSNLQVWYESNYDTRLIHKNLAFPLLEKLAEVGDPIAKKVFVEEVSLRFSEGNDIVRDFLTTEGYLRHFKFEQFYSLLFELVFDSFEELLKIICTYFITHNDSVEDFFEFIASIEDISLRNFIRNPKESYQYDFYQALVRYLGRYRVDHPKSKFIREGFKKVGKRFLDSLLRYLIDDDGYICVQALEDLIYIDGNKMKKFLLNREYNFRLENMDLWDFQHLLRILLLCFTPEDLMVFLERNYKRDLIRIFLPQMKGFSYLRMSQQEEINITQFIAAFLLEEAGTEDYLSNLHNLGNLLVSIFLSELIDKNLEVNEEIIKTLAWIGEDARSKLENELYRLFDVHIVDEYKSKFREYFQS